MSKLLNLYVSNDIALFHATGYYQPEDMVHSTFLYIALRREACSILSRSKQKHVKTNFFIISGHTFTPSRKRCRYISCISPRKSHLFNSFYNKLINRWISTACIKDLDAACSRNLPIWKWIWNLNITAFVQNFIAFRRPRQFRN